MDIQPADPRARRLAIVLLVAGFVVGAILLVLFERARPEIGRWITQDREQAAFRARVVLGVVAGVVVAPLVGLAVYFYRLGSATVRSGRFPPPGAAMLYDTRIASGDHARLRGGALRAIGLALIAVAVGIAALLWRLASRGS